MSDVERWLQLIEAAMECTHRRSQTCMCLPSTGGYNRIRDVAIFLTSPSPRAAGCPPHEAHQRVSVHTSPPRQPPGYPTNTTRCERRCTNRVVAAPRMCESIPFRDELVCLTVSGMPVVQLARRAWKLPHKRLRERIRVPERNIIGSPHDVERALRSQSKMHAEYVKKSRMQKRRSNTTISSPPAGAWHLTKSQAAPRVCP